jgi:hypothetical protein
MKLSGSARNYLKRQRRRELKRLLQNGDLESPRVVKMRLSHHSYSKEAATPIGNHRPGRGQPACRVMHNATGLGNVSYDWKRDARGRPVDLYGRLAYKPDDAVPDVRKRPGATRFRDMVSVRAKTRGMTVEEYRQKVLLY